MSKTMRQKNDDDDDDDDDDYDGRKLSYMKNRSLGSLFIEIMFRYYESRDFTRETSFLYPCTYDEDEKKEKIRSEERKNKS